MSFHSSKIINGVKYYLTRYENDSVHNCKWEEYNDLIKRDYGLKQKLSRFDVIFSRDSVPINGVQMINIDPFSYSIDRIVNAMEIFSFIHPKKASEVQGKWTESYLFVLRNLASYKHNNIKYGRFYIDLSDHYSMLNEFKDEIPFDLTIISNRVYLDYYIQKNCFWEDLTKMFTNVNRFCDYLSDDSDLRSLNNRMIYITKVLHEKWYEFMQLKVVQANNYKQFIENVTDYDLKYSKVHEIIKNYEIEEYSEGQCVEQMLDLFKQPLCIFSFQLDTQDNYLPNTILKLETIISENEINKEKNINKATENSQTKSIDDQIEDESIIKIDKTISEDQNKVVEDLINIDEITITEDLTQTATKSNWFDSNIKNKKEITNNPLFQIFNSIKERLLYLENLHNAVFTEEYYKVLEKENGIIDCLPEFFKEETINEWIENEHPKIFLDITCKGIYLIKWQNMSYTDLTWETGTDSEEWTEKINYFKRCLRSPDKNQRKIHSTKIQFFEILKMNKRPGKKSEKLKGADIAEAKKKFYSIKEQKSLVNYTVATQPIYKDGKTLKSYQLVSLNWLVNSWHKHRNVILADEMGLGKTIQTMAFISHLISVEHNPGPYLIIAPLSTLSHWKRTFDEWTHFNCLLYYDADSKRGRDICKQHEFYHKDILCKGVFVQNQILKTHVIITSYEVFIQDYDFMKDLPFQHIVIDEAHRLKNKTSKVIALLNQIVCNKITLLTGTPIQNNISELWTLLNFIEPNVFNDHESFNRNYGENLSSTNIGSLKSLIEPYLLRRLKDEVENSIPPLQETIVDVELTHIQKIVYKTIYEKNKGLLQKGVGLGSISLMNNLEMQLRKCCNHPFLIADVFDELTKDCLTDVAYFEKLISSSGKMYFLDQVLETFRVSNSKVLIFSQFTEMLKIIEEYLNYKGYSFRKIDGSTKSKDRGNFIDSFNRNTGVFEIFLLSTKAGGVGINLTAANKVIIYDSDWNPQNDLQAIARAHRIGQIEEVTVFRLISKQTYESEMFQRASQKLGLDKAILLSGNELSNNDKKNGKEDVKVKADEIEILLRKGILGVLNTTDTEEIHNNITDLITNSKTAKYNIGGGHSFKKTGFSDQNNNHIQLDDPDFWKKVFQDQQTTVDKLKKELGLVFGTARNVNIEAQKNIFLKISLEVYQYMQDQLKSDIFNTDIEYKFEELINRLLEEKKLHSNLKHLALQLQQDLKRKSRRIKVIDREVVESVFKGHAFKRSTGESSNAELAGTQTNRRSVRIKEGALNKRELIESSSEAEPENSTEEKEYVNPIKPLPEECMYCGKLKPEQKCIIGCQRNSHDICFNTYISTVVSKHESLKTVIDGDNHQNDCDIRSDLFVDNACLFCRKGIKICLECQKYSVNGIDSETRKGKNTPIIKCHLCPNFLHGTCFASNGQKSKDNLKCGHHFCSICKEFSKTLLKCVMCQFSCHKKCLKKTETLKLRGHYILCKNHKDIVQFKNLSEEMNDKGSNSKKVKTNSKTNEMSISNDNLKSIDINTKPDIYDILNIKRPSTFNYPTTKEVK